VEERRRPTPEYRFRHGLVHEATYRSLLDERRRELHRVVGTALEELHGEELSEAYGLLARHFAEADEPEKAARYLLEAGDAARAVFAEDEAIAQYRRALPFLDRLGDSARARSVLFKIAATHHLAFDFEAANVAWAQAFSRPEPPPSRLERTERIETLIPPTSGGFAPGYTYDLIGWSYAPNLYRGLMALKQGLEVVPDLAEHMAVSAEGITYRFGLRPGLRWSDGELLTAGDFAFTYRAMEEMSVPTAHLLAGIECEVLDDRTLELRLEQPRPYLPYLLAQAPLFPWPRHLVDALGDSWRDADAFVGNGPFVMARSAEGDLFLAANQLWHGSHGNVSEIAVGVRHPKDALDEWRSGRFDFLFAEDRFDLPDAPDTYERRIPLIGVGYVAFNPSRAPLDDERVRRTLAHGLDRRPLLTPGHEPAFGGFLPSAVPGHSHDLALPFDLERARALLAEAGFPGGEGLPELELVHPNFSFSREFRRKVEARWRSPWHELGVRVRQEWIDAKALLSGDFVPSHVWEWAWAADYPDPDGMIGSFLATHGSSYPGLEPLAARARSTRSRDDRLRLYRELDRELVAERVGLVPMFYDAWFLTHRPWLEGVWATPTQLGSLEEVVVRRPS
jgi:oligopeptide transport system substrate-binding protein